jgi:hypothetical protein
MDSFMKRSLLIIKVGDLLQNISFHYDYMGCLLET